MSEQPINSLLTIKMPSIRHVDQTNDKKIVTYYPMYIYNKYSKNPWSLVKCYSDFNALFKVLNKLFPKCPIIPGKSFFGMGLSEEELSE